MGQGGRGRLHDRRARAGRCARPIRTPHFWLLFAVYMFTGLGSFLVALHQLAFAVDIGFDKLYAAGVLGMGAFLSLPGVIITGTLSDYVGREMSAVVTYGTSILGVVFALMITSPDQHLLLWLHACFFGLTWGARGPAITAKTADLFPGPNLGAILGVITIGTGAGRRRAAHGWRGSCSIQPAATGWRSSVDRVLCLPAASRSGRCGGRRRSARSNGPFSQENPMLFLVISEPRPERAVQRHRGAAELLDLDPATDRRRRGPLGPRQGRPRRGGAVRRRLQ